MDLDNIRFINALDMKLALISCGLSGARYPCVWCDLNKKKFRDDNRRELRELRTVGAMRSYAKEYQEAVKIHKGSGKLSAAPYKSCQYEPLVALDDSTLIIDVLPPMELHLLLGIVNKLYNHLDEV